ncbi:hypothetical protein WJX77_001364 [Trebouxia sp. C0004]
MHRHDLERMEHECPHCKALHWAHERTKGSVDTGTASYGMCCMHGAVRLPALHATPEPLNTLLQGGSAEAKHFLYNIRHYNAEFQMASTGVKDVRQSFGWMHKFCAGLRAYHMIGLPPESPGVRPTYLSLYIYVANELDDRMHLDVAKELQRGTMERLQRMLQSHNPFVQCFKAINMSEFGPNVNIVLHADVGFFTFMTVHDVKRCFPTHVTVSTMVDRGQEGNARCSITPKEWAAYYLSVREYIVDAYGKTEYEKLLYHRYNQDKIHADLYNGLMDAVRANDGIRGNAVGMPIILPSSFVGGARSMREKYQDAMAVVRVKGKPSLFITMTCNPTWPETQCELLPGQCAKDRPDLVARVFNGKTMTNCVDDYDSVVSAQLPDPDVRKELHDIVGQCMMHGPCGKLNESTACMHKGQCVKGFPKDFSEETMENIEGAPIYRRPDNGRYVMRNNVKLFNDMVVPYNPALLLKYNCHINVEVVSNVRAVKYLYKYILKGGTRAAVELRAPATPNKQRQPSMNVQQDADSHDEIQHHIDGRFFCSSEASWRLMAFEMDEVLNKESRTTLTEWFATNLADPSARQHSYLEFPQHYTWDKNTERWSKRKTNEAAVGRMYNTLPGQGERHYIRLLLC